jgi:hypothetical protein
VLPPGEETVMPKFHFNIDDGASAPDVDGTELKSFAVAKCEAMQMAGRIICDAAESFWDQERWTMTVTDEDGLTLLTLDIVGVEAPAGQLLTQAHLEHA